MDNNHRIIDELCARGQLEKYRETVEQIIIIANQYGFGVCTRYDSLKSNIEWGKTKIIRIAINEETKGLGLIWDLLHEIGHLIDGEPKKEDFCKQEIIAREEKAWENAWGMVQSKLIELISEYNHFEKHKRECLLTYHKMSNCIK